MRGLAGRMRLLQRAPFESAVAFATLVSAIVYLIVPGEVGRSAVGRTAQSLLPLWEALYGASGLLVLGGLLVGSIRAESMGLCLLAAALAINAVSIVDFTGLSGIASAATFGGLGFACGLRLHFLWGLWRLAQERE